MKKGCLIVAIGVIALVGVAVAAGGYYVDRQFGLSLAEEVSHETLADAQTRVRAVVKLDKLRDLLLRAVPPGTELPAWLPWNLSELVDEALPREVALLGGPDYVENVYRLTAFANERRGGPFMVDYVNNKSTIFTDLQVVEWEPELAVLQKRGVITAKGSLPMPSDTESLVLEHWTHDEPAERLIIDGGHLIEISFDNRNGDLMALLHTISAQRNFDYNMLAIEQPMFKGVLDMIPLIETMRAEADLVDADTAHIRIRVHGEEKALNQITFINFILPQVNEELKKQYGLTLEGKFEKDVAAGVATGDFDLRGIEQLLQRSVPNLQPSTPATASAPQETN